jgi:glucose/arabinose dehydrogenase
MAGLVSFGGATTPALAHDPQPVPSDAGASDGGSVRPSDGLVLGGASTAEAEFVVPNFQEEVIWSGFTFPTVVAFADDGRALVAEKSGIIKVFTSLDDPFPSTYADLRTNVHDFWDRGLLGMALDPDFTTNGRIYVAYTYNPVNATTGQRWPDGTCPNPPGATSDGCVVYGRLSALTNGGAEQVLVQDWCQQFPSHSMSDIAFDAEGALIVAAGDGASFITADWGQLGGAEPGTPTPRNPCGDPPGGLGGAMSVPTAEGGALRAQDIRTTGDPTGLAGTVIRVNRFTGDPMSDNPTAAGSANQRRIIGYGLRNPFRLTIHPVTGELYVGDVGWGTREEVNRHTDPDGAVRNFGWPCREGTFSPSEYAGLNLCSSLTSSTAPHFEYQHGAAAVSGDGCDAGSSSISGLAFYPGGDYPAIYDNALFFADYSRNCAWVMPNGAGNVPNAGGRFAFAELDSPVHLAVGPGNDIFYVDFGVPGGALGSVRRISYLGSNNQPHAAVEADPTSGSLPLSVDFDASESSDPDDDPLTYAWDFGDNDGLFNDATGATPSHTYTTSGTFTARVRVSDGLGGRHVASVQINAANQAPTAFIDSPSASLTWSVGQQIAFSGHATDPNQAMSAGTLRWDLVMAHCPDSCHEHVVGSFSGVSGGSFAAPDHEYPSHLVLRLTATDSQGASDMAEIELHPATRILRLRSSPSGMSLSAAGVTRTTPFDVTVIAGSAVQLSAATGQVSGGFPFTWSSWSDGGAQTHTVIASSTRTITATYAVGFDDVPPGTAFRSDITWLVLEGITAGCSSSPPLYCPTGLVTRGQMATFLSRALDLPSTSTDFFIDDETNKHESSINRLAAAGITFGCGPDRYCPNGLVTRAQMATFLGRALHLPATSTDFFTDDETNGHEQAINRLAAAGITSGCGPGRFCPDGIVTRGQMAAFLRRGLDD